MILSDPVEFLNLAIKGGEIVCSNECSSTEIALAQACGRFYVSPDNFGWVYRPRKSA